MDAVEIDYLELYYRAGGGEPDPYPQYQFGGDRKTFWSNFQSEGVYDKPITVVDGVTVHLPDPDLVNHNP